ncbi:uncharacterized protein LOC132250061 [Alligator mississippiensis]|uniref:uncharacterized protein LOC132250061 n=1 Tax=Alligator mississippiensis TaxID=8496 RepID=UPI002877AF8C|nr:uncharacterized protein LOC132250061 [Alligator mississippiensis]
MSEKQLVTSPRRDISGAEPGWWLSSPARPRCPGEGQLRAAAAPRRLQLVPGAGGRALLPGPPLGHGPPGRARSRVRGQDSAPSPPGPQTGRGLAPLEPPFLPPAKPQPRLLPRKQRSRDTGQWRGWTRRARSESSAKQAGCRAAGPWGTRRRCRAVSCCRGPAGEERPEGNFPGKGGAKYDLRLPKYVCCGSWRLHVFETLDLCQEIHLSFPSQQSTACSSAKGNLPNLCKLLRSCMAI